MRTLSTASGAVLRLDEAPPRRGGESLVYDAVGPDGPCVVKVALEPRPFGDWLDGERERLAALAADPATRDLVPRVLDHGAWDGRPFVALERFAATLADVVALEPSPARRLALAAAVAERVARLHAARPELVHRDLKPSNVLVTGDRIVLTDFGIARELAAGRTTTTRALFTPDYAAPEQALPHRCPDRSWDLYGLAATVYHVLVGEPATAPATNAWCRTAGGHALRAGRDDGRGPPEAYLDLARMEALTRSDLARLDAVVEGPIRRALLDALAPDPRRRHGSAERLAAALRRSRPRRRGRWRGAAAAALALAALAAGLAFLAGGGDPAPAYPVVPVPGGVADGPDGPVEVAPFLAGEHEVTQALWQALMGDGLATRRRLEVTGLGQPCATFEGLDLVGPDLPMTCVSFHDAVTFANRLSERHGLTPAYTVATDPLTGRWSVALDPGADGWRLPTLAEWRRAVARPEGLGDPCAENVADRRYGDRFPGALAERCDDGFVGPAPVGSFPPGPHGLRDGYGNANEWLWDAAGEDRWIAGGTWTGAVGTYEPYPWANPGPPWNRAIMLGFRLVRSAP